MLAGVRPQVFDLLLFLIRKREKNTDAKRGGAEGIRTPDLRSAIAALSQLSYGPALIRKRA
jgi:hypothetical protein